MRKSMVILGACLVLALGITGCSDDDLLDQTISFDQQVTLAAQAVITGINAVTALATIFPPPLSSATGSATGPRCFDAIPDICDLGGTAQICDGNTIFLDQCEVTGVGRLNGDPNPAATLVGLSADLNLSIDDDTFLSGTVSGPAPAVSAAEFGVQCFQLNYVVTLSNGVSSSMLGDLLQCTDGNVTNFLVVETDLNLELRFFFQGEFALISVFELGKKSSQLDEFCFDLMAQEITSIQNCEL